MHYRLLAVAAVFTFLAGGQPADDAVKREFKDLQGAWVVADAEKDGLPLDRIKGGTLVITGPNFAIKTASGTVMKGDLQLDPAKKPKRMDLLHQQGILLNKTWQAVCELKGDELKICYAEADLGKDRPGEFKTSQDSGFLLVTLTRKK